MGVDVIKNLQEKGFVGPRPKAKSQIFISLLPLWMTCKKALCRFFFVLDDLNT